MKYAGALGSTVVKVFDATAAATGLTETELRQLVANSHDFAFSQARA